MYLAFTEKSHVQSIAFKPPWRLTWVTDSILLQLQNENVLQFQVRKKTRFPLPESVYFTLTPKQPMKLPESLGHALRNWRYHGKHSKMWRQSVPIAFSLLALLFPLSSHREEVMQESLTTQSGEKIINGTGEHSRIVAFGKTPYISKKKKKWGVTLMMWERSCHTV